MSRTVLNVANVPLFTRYMGSWETYFVSYNTEDGGSSSYESLVFTHTGLHGIKNHRKFDLAAHKCFKKISFSNRLDYENSLLSSRM